METMLSHIRGRGAKAWLVDVGVALATLLFGVLQLVVTSTTVFAYDDPFGRMAGIVNVLPGYEAYMALAAMTVPLFFRRLAPKSMFALTCVVYGLCVIAMPWYPFSLAFVLVALYTVVRSCSNVASVVCFSSAALLAAVLPDMAASTLLSVMFRLQSAVYCSVAALAGYAVRSHEALLEGERAKAVEAQRSKEEHAARRVSEERVRIARDVHDITAHSLSAVAIQAAVASRMIDSNPEAAKEAIEEVRSVSKSSLDEIRALVGVLRDSSTVQTSPTEGTEHLPDLVDYARSAGIELTFDLNSYRKDVVPAYADITAYAVIREAVTNVVRHSGARHATVSLASTSDAVWFEVKDDGHGFDSSSASERPTGHGLAGMGERLEAIGGRTFVESVPGQGCSVRGWIPLEAIHGQQ